MSDHYDFLIKNAKVFDGSAKPINQDIAILDGKIAARGVGLSDENAVKVIDASGKWAMPGLFDIHTHYDLELEMAPGLPESTRHGTTTVVIANCSLGLAFGSQRKGEADPIVDCYARVENIPKSVLKLAADNVSWETPAEYLHHLNTLNLGPNVATLFPHSMMRIDAMGFDASISRGPTSDELNTMKKSLKEGLEMGYVGFSTDALPFHYLANQPNTAKTIPTQFAQYSEIKALTQVVRDNDAVWQATPPKDSAVNTLKTFLLTSGRLHGKPMKTTVVAALDIHNNRKIIFLGRLMAKLLNSKWVQGKLYLQSLGAPFKTWADGAVTPLSEEIPELRRLNETDLEEREKRAQIMADPEYIKSFKAMWLKGKQGRGIDRMKTLLRIEDYAFNRVLGDMTVEVCPVDEWEGRNFQEVFDRIVSFNMGSVSELTAKEKGLIGSDFFWIGDEADFMLQMLRTFDSDLSWSTTSANRNLSTVRELLMDPLLLPGFNDSGAHLTNMAFYDVNLRSLKLAAQGGDSDVAFMVKRLTRDPAEVFGIEGGTIEVGDQADVILIDPEQLQNYDGEANVERIYREEFKHEQLVNRSKSVVPLVMISGKIAWENEHFSADLGTQKMGNVRLGKNARAPLIFRQ
ncbi:N-acyl-D-glutamate deacylase [Gammaproteobacteria bacterium 45_16_T64]|nr:N-acyl-D-glutamate deacylase [Gammaproteobacteria bacterium 45_16_T64]